MKSTVFTELFFLPLFLCGCSMWNTPGSGVSDAQRDARARLAEIRRAELLDSAAKIQIEHTKTVPLLRAAQNYRGELRNAADDPALKTLDSAIIYAKIATAEDPAAESSRLAAKLVDFDTAVLCCKWLCCRDRDIETSLLFVTGWTPEKLRLFDASSVKTPEFRLFPAHPESEERLRKEGREAPFLLAAELYRFPSSGAVAFALQFRKTLLNTHILNAGMKPENDPQRILELRLVALREKLFQ